MTPNTTGWAYLSQMDTQYRQLLLKQYPAMDCETDGLASAKMPSSRHPEIDRFQSSRQDLSPKNAFPPGSVVACGMPGAGDGIPCGDGGLHCGVRPP
jgi:hypothetical protein